MKTRVGTGGGQRAMVLQMAQGKRSRRVKAGVLRAWAALLRVPPCSPSRAVRMRSRVLRVFVGQWRRRVVVSRKVWIACHTWIARHTSHVTRHTSHVTRIM